MDKTCWNCRYFSCGDEETYNYCKLDKCKLADVINDVCEKYEDERETNK